MKHYRQKYRTFFDTLNKNLVWPKDVKAQSICDKMRIVIKVKEGDNLQSMFDRFLDLGEKEDTFLFRELDYQCREGFHNWRLFLDWDVQFESKFF